MKSYVVRLNRQNILDICNSLKCYDKILLESDHDDSDDIYHLYVEERKAEIRQLFHKMFDLLNDEN